MGTQSSHLMPGNWGSKRNSLGNSGCVRRTRASATDVGTTRPDTRAATVVAARTFTAPRARIRHVAGRALRGSPTAAPPARGVRRALW